MALDTMPAGLNSAAMRLSAPAKINLHLRVGPRRADGFHPLLSWMTTVALFDSLTLQPQALPEALAPKAAGGAVAPAVEPSGGPVGDASPGVSLSCDMPGLPCDGRNLVVRIALAWMRETEQAAPRPLRVTLQKRIPVGAGLGGGSSDAARTLMGLNQLWKTGRAANDLSAFAARFGSDLPFFFHGSSSVCRGRGDIVEPIPRPAVRWAVLVLPKLAMPTAAVYQHFDQLGLGREQDVSTEPDWHQWAAMNSEKLLPRLVNDLEPPAFAIASRLGALRRRVEQLLNRPVRMSGSGSSLFTLFDASAQATEAAERIEHDLNERASAVELSPDFHDALSSSV